MDAYTEKTASWLDKRFRKTRGGVYYAHQPIYGFRVEPSESDVIARYTISNQILKLLSRVQFASFIDVGAAEGFKSFIVKSLFGTSRTVAVDVSAEAANRAREIFGLESYSTDIHKLPFKNEEFEVVLSSETLEHIWDWQSGVDELLRICKTALLITVPHEPIHVVEANRKSGANHAHIHHFNLGSFDFLKARGYSVHKSTCQFPGTRIIRFLIEARYLDAKKRSPLKLLAGGIYTAMIPLLRYAFGKRSVSLFVKLDEKLCRTTGLYENVQFLIVKNPAKVWEGSEVKGIDDLLEIAVPPFRM